MSFLDVVTSGKQRAPRRVMLYGSHGIGKSTWAASAPSALFLPTEDGIKDIDCKSVPVIDSYGVMLSTLAELYTEEHDFSTVVIDSLDWLERLIWAEVCTEKSVESIDDIGYAKGYSFALYQWRTILTALDSLREFRSMAVVLLAHAKVERFEHPETEPFDRWAPRLHKHASAMVQEWCDEVLFASYKVHTRTKEGDFGKERSQGIGKGERVVRTQERPAHVAKNRLNLPLEIPLSWDAYAQAASV